MRSITQHYEGKNIYTRPLQGKPYYRNSGIIYAVDRSGNKYSVARVDLERFDDQNFQYVFTLIGIRSILCRLPFPGYPWA